MNFSWPRVQLRKGKLRALGEQIKISKRVIEGEVTAFVSQHLENVLISARTIIIVCLFPSSLIL